MDDWDAVSDATPQNSAASSWDAVSSKAPQGRKPRKPVKLSLSWRFVLAVLAALLALALVGSGIFVLYHASRTAIPGTATPITINGTQAGSSTATFATPENTPDATATVQANTALADATATVTAAQTLYTQVTSGTPVLDDPLTDNRNNWPVSSGKGWSCAFAGGAYHMMESQGHASQGCYLRSMGSLNNNFAWQAQVSTLNGDDAGLTFSHSGDYYLAEISSGGSYLLFKGRSHNNNGAFYDTRVSSAIHTTGQANVLTFIMDNGFLYFFVNGQYMNGVYIGAYSNGIAGLCVEDDNQATDAAFSAAKLWTF
jgi:hypothetical protein